MYTCNNINILYMYVVCGISNGQLQGSCLPPLSDGHLAFEAVTTPGHHVGVLDDGSVKSPHHTGVGKHGQFYPKVKKNSPSMTFLAGRGRLQVLYSI